MAAQLVLAVSPLAEGRESMASHIESSGAVPGHFGHNEATCPACIARWLHSPAPKRPAPVFDAPVHATAVLDLVANDVFGEYSPQSNPRAPPSSV